MKKKRTLVVLGILIGAIAVAILAVVLLTPWMDRWGATKAEIQATYPGDALLKAPASLVNRAITIHASAGQVYPWIIQLGAGRGGFYSHSWLETYLLNCKLVNADRIHPEWQDLKVGGQVKMCPGSFGPAPYLVAQLTPNRSVVLGHQDKGQWVDIWEFNLIPQPDGTTRLILRTRTMMTGGFWDIIHPGVFIMETGMLQGIRDRAEALQDKQYPTGIDVLHRSDIPSTNQRHGANHAIREKISYPFRRCR